MFAAAGRKAFAPDQVCGQLVGLAPLAAHLAHAGGLRRAQDARVQPASNSAPRCCRSGLVHQHIQFRHWRRARLVALGRHHGRLIPRCNRAQVGRWCSLRKVASKATTGSAISFRLGALGAGRGHARGHGVRLQMLLCKGCARPSHRGHGGWPRPGLSRSRYRCAGFPARGARRQGCWSRAWVMGMGCCGAT